MDPLAGTAWSAAGTVEGFVRSSANTTLLNYAARLQYRREPLRVLDIGCGAGRNAIPLAETGALVTGTDLSWPMIEAAAARATNTSARFALAPMDALPVRSRSFDLIIAHGIWNLATSGEEFRRALREAGRAAAAAARLFVFTFSRRTLAADARPVKGETIVFTQFSGTPQVFLTRDQLVNELTLAGFVADPALPLRELNIPLQGSIRLGGPPVIFEGGFIFAGASS